MKNFAKKVVLWLLKVMAKHRMRKFKGKVIAVTGSVGKTSSKEAIFAVLNSQLKVKRNDKSFNSEFGLLLTILDIESGFSSATKWSWYLIKGFFHCMARDHSEVLLLEYGVNKPGDMDFLLSVAKPDIAVITSVSHTHMASGQFESVEQVFEEKSKLVRALSGDGVAVLNVDNEHLATLAKGRKKAQTLTFGSSRDADIWASQVKSSLEGLEFILHHNKDRHDVSVPTIGAFNIYVFLPAIACGSLLGLPVEAIIHAISKFTLPPGRMGVIEAISGATLLDSSYNSSPAALKAALETLADLAENRRRVAVLGNMNELGGFSKDLHEKLGEILPKHVDLLLTIGSDAAIMADSARAKGLDSKYIFKFRTANEAAEFFKEKIKKNDLVLVKGSQNNVRLERFVKALMAHPEDAKELLVRQENVWQAKL